jgi:small-conductance mechanosensitive channel
MATRSGRAGDWRSRHGGKTCLLSVLPAFGFCDGVALAAEGASGEGRSGLIPLAASAIARLWREFEPLWASLPSIPGELWTNAAKIAASSADGFLVDMGKAALGIGALLIIGWLIRYRNARESAARAAGDRLTAIVRRFLSDCVALFIGLMLAVVMAQWLFSGKGTASSDLGAALIDFAIRFRLATLVPKFLFRWDEPHLRLIEASDGQVRDAKPWFHAALAIGLGFPALIPVWIAVGMQWEAAQALAVTVGIIVAMLGYVAVARFLKAGEGLWPRWRGIAGALAFAFALAWGYGVVALDFPFFFLVVQLGTIGVAALVFDRFISTAQRIAAVGAANPEGSYRFWRAYGTALRRAAWVVAGGGVLLTLSAWLVEVAPNILGPDRLAMFDRALGASLFVFLIGYLAAEFLLAWTREKFAPLSTVTLPGEGDDEGHAPASRLATIMPVAQGFFAVLILGMATLIALSRLGVDTTPILAGAGIFGLAISFGSQSLVRDIVAGIFFMADDAFRIGEYIEAGRLKGSVERISLRSVRLRHQNGQVHTIPFGQLGAVTNYSRDYITMKFNLRLARESDLELVRKTVKKIGLEMMEDTEFGKEFIQPLKMQGVADIEENALVIRFKFTVRPGKPTYVQREAIKRMLRAFAEKGIRFASHTVTIQSATGDDDADDGEAGRRAVADAVTRNVQLPPQPAR